MQIESPAHALILMSKGEIVCRKTRLKSNNGSVYLFARIEDRVWPAIVLEDSDGREHSWSYREVRHHGLEILNSEITCVPFEE